MSATVGFEMVAVGEPMRPATRAPSPLADTDVRIRVAGCGVCHTDLGFLYDGVPTRHALPLILGHEISGVVEAAGADFTHLVGKAVLVPAVIPCGECSACKAGKEMICPKQVMPGNDRDGGFASHTVLPGRGLCLVPGATADFDAPIGSVPGLTLRHLAVIADAVSTPYRAVKRSGLQAGEVAIVVGLGGVGGYAAQIAAARGAFVVGLDINAAKLSEASKLGVQLAVDPRDMSSRDLKKHIKAAAREAGFDPSCWTIFECSGSTPGQKTAFGLLVHGATLMVVGFTMGKLELRLSNLMAFDARAMGTWGCEPSLYPELLDMVLDGRIDVLSHTELRPLSGIVSHFSDVHAHTTHRRLVLTPDPT